MRRVRSLGALGLLLVAVAGCAEARARRNQSQDPATALTSPPPNLSSQQPTAPWPNDPFAPRGGYGEGVAPFAANQASPGPTRPGGPDRPGVLRRPDPSIRHNPGTLLASTSSPARPRPRSQVQPQDHEPTIEPTEAGELIPTLPVAMIVEVCPDDDPAAPLIQPGADGPSTPSRPSQRLADADLPPDARFFRDLKPFEVGATPRGSVVGRFGSSPDLRDTDTRQAQVEIIDQPAALPVAESRQPLTSEPLPLPLEADTSGETVPDVEPVPTPRAAVPASEPSRAATPASTPFQVVGLLAGSSAPGKSSDALPPPTEGSPQAAATKPPPAPAPAERRPATSVPSSKRLTAARRPSGRRPRQAEPLPVALEAEPLPSATEAAPVPTALAAELVAAAEEGDSVPVTTEGETKPSPAAPRQPALAESHPEPSASRDNSIPIVAEATGGRRGSAAPPPSRPRPRLTRIPGPGPATPERSFDLQDPLTGALFPPSYYGTLVARAEANAAAATVAEPPPRPRRRLSWSRLFGTWRNGGAASPHTGPAPASAVPPAPGAISTWSQPGNVPEHG
ncbi:MAG TPA: hypothetical protein VGZ22_13890 [Isosphaeraceae bacterium]|nr:hypothetical protein [Isosphaeraceae bacterium]